MHFRSSLKVKVQNGGSEWGMFLGLEKIQLFFEVLVIPDIFWGKTGDAGSEPTCLIVCS